MQSRRERTTLAEKRGGYVHRTNRCEDEPAFEPVGHRGSPLDTPDCRKGKPVRTSESVPSESFLWAAVHQVSRRSGGLPCERRTVARTIFAPSCPLLSSIGHQGMEHIQV
jgi:hypothetical protein